jgi:hypothetical protein
MKPRLPREGPYGPFQATPDRSMPRCSGMPRTWAVESWPPRAQAGCEPMVRQRWRHTRGATKQIACPAADHQRARDQRSKGRHNKRSQFTEVKTIRVNYSHRTRVLSVAHREGLVGSGSALRPSHTDPKETPAAGSSPHQRSVARMTQCRIGGPESWPSHLHARPIKILYGGTGAT